MENFNTLKRKIAQMESYSTIAQESLSAAVLVTINQWSQGKIREEPDLGWPHLLNYARYRAKLAGRPDKEGPLYKALDAAVWEWRESLD